MVLAQFKWLVKINEAALDLWLGYAPVPSRSEPHERPGEADGMQSISWRMWDINYNHCIQTRHNKTWHVPNKDTTHTYLDIHKNTSSLHGDVLRTPEKSSHPRNWPRRQKRKDSRLLCLPGSTGTQPNLRGNWKMFALFHWDKSPAVVISSYPVCKVVCLMSCHDTTSPKTGGKNHLWARSCLKFHQPQNQQLDTKRLVGFQKESMIHLHQISGMASHPKRQRWWIDENWWWEDAGFPFLNGLLFRGHVNFPWQEKVQFFSMSSSCEFPLNLPRPQGVAIGVPGVTIAQGQLLRRFLPRRFDETRES